MSDIEWSEIERAIAKKAFEKAYQREIDTLTKAVREKASAIADIEDIWHLHDFLSTQRHEIDGKYDFRYPGLIFALARLVKEDWLHLNELSGLNPDKLTKIAALTRM